MAAAQIGALIGVTLLLIATIVIYNAIVRAKIRVRQAWAQVAVQLQRRHDLIPRLVAVVRAYSGHERDIITNITRLRAAALEASPAKRGEAEDAVSDALGQLLLLTEDYPALRADSTYLHLSSELRDTEDRIAFARDFANNRVATFQRLTTTFPTNLFAKLFRFSRQEMFAVADPRAAAAPEIDLREPSSQ